MSETEFWHKEFPATCVTREDLVVTGFSRAIVEKLSDKDMQQIASAMEDVYCNSGFWEDLELCTKRVLEHKEEDAILTQKHQPAKEESEK